MWAAMAIDCVAPRRNSTWMSSLAALEARKPWLKWGGLQPWLQIAPQLKEPRVVNALKVKEVQ